MSDPLWQTVLGEIELSVSRASFQTWFKSTKLLSNENGTITVGVTNVFAKQQFEDKYNEKIRQILEKNGTKPKKLRFIILKSGEAVEDSLPNQQASSPRSVYTPPTTAIATDMNAGSHNGDINSKYTFNTFIVGASNDLAYAACQAISKNPGHKYNPLFIYGQAGLGKTHLIQAVGNEIRKSRPDSKVVYVTCETFVQEFLDSIRYKKKGFSSKYRNVDVLIVDDIQFIAGKERTEEAFFHTFNALHQANKQIILSSDKPPKSIPILEERLRSRFEWGMTVDIQPPDFETRCAIIHAKAATHNIVVEHAAVEYMAKQIQSNVRELEGKLNQIIAFCELRNLTPTMEVVSSLLGDQKQSPKRLTSKQVVEKTARYFQVDVDILLSSKRDKDIVFPRQVAMYLLRNELHMSYPKVANALGRKDHTTAIHSVGKITKSMPLNQVVRQSINEIKERLYA